VSKHRLCAKVHFQCYLHSEIRRKKTNDKDHVNDKNIEIVVVKYYKVVDYKYVKILQIINISLMK